LAQKKAQQADAAKLPAPKPKAPSKPEPAKVQIKPDDLKDGDLEDPKQRLRRVGQLAKRQEELEKSIAALEKDKKEVEDQFLDPELVKRPDKMKLLSEKYSKLKEELDANFDKWQELEGRKSALTA
jgi:hypothetical protein